jgi:PAS domain S-box-containing protein
VCSLTNEGTRPRLHFRLPLDPARLLRARQRIRDYLHERELEPGVIEDVVLAVEEAMSNAVRHSGAIADLEVDLWSEGGDLIAEVRDHGHGFDVDRFDRRRLPDPLSPSGRGLFLIAHLMDELEMRSESGLTVRAVKRDVLTGSGRGALGLAAAMPGAEVHRDARQQALLEEIEEAFFALDWEYRYTFVNEAAERMWRKSREDHLGRTVSEVYPRTPPRVLQALRESMELGRPALVEVQSVERGTWREYRSYPTSMGVVAYVRDIDERKRKELERDELVDALRLSREDLDRAQAVGQIGSWRLDVCRDVLSWSDENHRIFGVPKGAPLTYRTFLSRVLSEDRAYVDARWRAALGGEPYDIEHRILVNGQVKWVREKAFLEFDAAGGLQSGFGITQDITERKLAEEALRRTTASLDLAVRAAGAGTWSWDVKTGRIDWSSELYEVFGIDPTLRCASFEAWNEVIHADDRAIANARIEQALSDHAELDSEYRIVRFGEERWISALGKATYDEQGDPIRMSGLCIDVTERKRAESAFRQSEEQFVALFDSMLEGVVLHELVYADGHPVDYRILAANPAFERQSGMSRERALGCLASDLYGTGAAPYLAEYARVAESGESYSFETYFAPLERHFQITAVSPAPGRFATIFEDITERKRADEQLQRSLAEYARLADRQARQAARLTVLKEIAETATSALSVVDFAQRVAATVPGVLGASHVMVALPDDSGSRLNPVGTFGYPPGLHAGVMTPASEASQLMQAYSSAESVYVESPETAANDVSRTGGRRHGIASFAAMPLPIADKPIGVLGVGWSEPRRFTSDEVELLTSLAAELAVGLEKARLDEAQRRVATTLQENFVHPLPLIAGLELAALSLPASAPELVGGDFHDVFVLPDGRVLALIGDVMGKGIKAAGLTETVHSAVRALALVAPSPAKILRQVNRLLLLEEYEQLVTALVVVFAPSSGRGLLASAGHPPPIVVSRGHSRRIEPRYGPPLGAFESTYSAREFKLAGGEALLLYSDGLTEARRNGELFGEGRLLDATRDAPDHRPQALVEHLRTTVLAYAGALKDDLEILALCPAEQSG